MEINRESIVKTRKKVARNQGLQITEKIKIKVGRIWISDNIDLLHDSFLIILGVENRI